MMLMRVKVHFGLEYFYMNSAHTPDTVQREVDTTIQSLLTLVIGYGMSLM